MTKLKLNVTEVESDFFENTQLLGLMTQSSDYTVSWALNRYCNFDFRLRPELEISLRRNGRQYYFEVFEFTDNYHHLQYYLYANHFRGEYLLKQYMHLNFLLLIKNDGATPFNTSLLEKQLKLLGEIQLVVTLTHTAIKDRSNLIF
jgi:hypothetical protein